MKTLRRNISTRMQTSPWIILGSTLILLIVVIVFAFQNAHREKQYMSKILSTKGAALIRAVEAGARAGMMESNTAGERHDCYRRAAKVSGARAKRCIAEGNR